MHTPTKSQWQAVINNFKKVLPMAKEDSQLDMLEPDVNNNHHSCGTVHCVGGWYAVACGLDNKDSTFITYRHGANEMARHLGFSHMDDLETWAGFNSNIWGNECGHNMFCNKSAYNYAYNLAEVLVHLEGVRDRSPE